MGMVSKAVSSAALMTGCCFAVTLSYAQSRYEYLNEATRVENGVRVTYRAPAVTTSKKVKAPKVVKPKAIKAPKVVKPKVIKVPKVFTLPRTYVPPVFINPPMMNSPLPVITFPVIINPPLAIVPPAVVVPPPVVMPQPVAVTPTPVVTPPPVTITPPPLAITPPVVMPPVVIVTPPAVITPPPAVVVVIPPVVITPPPVAITPPPAPVEPPVTVVPPAVTPPIATPPVVTPPPAVTPPVVITPPVAPPPAVVTPPAVITPPLIVPPPPAVTPPPEPAPPPVVTPPVVIAPPPAPSPPPSTGSAPPTTIGINVSGLAYFGNSRSYANLVAPGSWLSNKVAGYGPMPVDQIDANGNVKYLKMGSESWNGEKAIIPIPPLEGPYTTKDVRCTFDGKGKMGADSEGALLVKAQGSGFVDLLATWQTKDDLIKSGMITITETNPADPLRNIDCREKDMDKNLLWSPQFTESLKGFKTIRFLDWGGGNNIEAGKWDRINPVGHQFAGSIEGIRPQDMIALANTMDADPWIPMAYNGDENYHRQYATLVRDTMKPGRRAYVELGNEVWNYMFPVTGQARDEGVAAKLSPDPHQAMLHRYGQKSAWAMKIWSEVFAGQMHRLVRVVNVQSGGGWSIEQVLGFQDTHKVVDAVATAPYIQFKTDGLMLDQVFAGLNKATDEAIAGAVAAKVTANSYGKRLIAYEAGQHIVSDDIAFARTVQRDPRMEGVYKKYIDAWQKQVGDLIVMYAHTGPISKYGSWGLREYAGQPVSETPKWRAVQSYLKK